MNEIDELNHQILELNNKRNKLVSDQEQSKIEEFLTLKWTKHFDAFLKVNPYAVAGLPTYELLIPNCPYIFSKTIHVFGESSYYENNINYGISYTHKYQSLSTSSWETLVKFLSGIKFKTLDYNKDMLTILLAAKQCNERVVE